MESACPFRLNAEPHMAGGSDSKSKLRTNPTDGGKNQAANGLATPKILL